MNCEAVFSFAGLILLTACCAGASHLNVEVASDGSYSVTVDSEVWLTSGDTFFVADGFKYSAVERSLKLQGKPAAIYGVDKLGQWTGFHANYSAGENYVSVCWRLYANQDMAVFTQIFNDGLKNTSTSNANRVISGFPSFTTGLGTKLNLGFLQYSGLMAGYDYNTAGRWIPSMARLSDGLRSGPLLIFDEYERVVVISSFDHFMAASYEHNPKSSTVSWGIMGKVRSVPSGFTQSTVIVFGKQGFNKAVLSWGSILCRYYDRDTRESWKGDVSNRYVGYYTDNGAYYYHKTAPQLTMEDTVLSIRDYAAKLDLPYRYLQYDDWFYPTAGPTSYGATVTWDAMREVFPHGLQYLYNKTRLAVVAHNRYWSDKTPYALQNGGKFKFVFDGRGNALPDDQAFWDYLFSTAKTWGLVTYEQDWLNYQIESFEPVQEDLTLGTRWLHQMGLAADKYGLTIQYCMSLPRHLLAAVEINAVTQARASDDYVTPTQYRIGYTSLLVYSLGIAPFKDNFWTTSQQPGNPYRKSEANPKLQAVVALLSTGPVGVSDGIGFTDPDLVRRLTTSNGLLLQPSRPATAIDAQLMQAAFGGHRGPKGQVWTTESIVGQYLFGIIFAVELKEPYVLHVGQTGWKPQFESGYVFTSRYFMPAANQTAAWFDDATPLNLSACSSYTSMCLYYTSPLLTVSYLDRIRRFFLAGEMDKAVPISPRRIRSISATPDDVSLELMGSLGEIVNFDVCDILTDHSADPVVRCRTIECTISEFETARLSVKDSICY